jgi:cytochrome c oxidase subunit 2
MRNTIYAVLVVLMISMVLVACTQNAGTGNTQSNGNTQTGGNTDTSTSTSGNTGNTDTTGTTGGTDTSGGTTTGTEKTLNIVAYNFGFDVTGPDINVGDKVKVVVTSREGTHGIAIPDLGVNIAPVAPGDTKTAEFTATKAGSFTYFCNVPCGEGHRNMRGSIVVS